jgi:hypothetical protein
LAPAHVLDVLVHAEDLLHDQHRRQVPAAGGHGAVGRHLPVLHGDLHFAGREALRVGGDLRRGRHGLDGGGESGGERRHDEIPSGEVGLRLEIDEVGVAHGSSVGVGGVACDSERRL